MIAGLIGGSMPEEPQPESMNGAGIGADADPRATLYDLAQAGQMGATDITRAAGRVLYEIDRFGYLDHPPSHHSQPYAVAVNARVIEQTAVDGAVLLKNEGGILPLDPAALDSVALIGPGAAQLVAIGTAGERSTGLTARQVSPWAALKALAHGGAPVLAVADDMAGTVIPAAQLSHKGGPGLLRVGGANAGGSSDGVIDFTGRKALPANSATVWEGSLTVPTAGDYWIDLHLLGASGSVKIDGRLVAHAGAVIGTMHGDTVLAGKDGLLPTPGGLDNARGAVMLSAGAHHIWLGIKPDTSDAPAQVRLAWTTPESRAATRAAAIAAARQAKVAVVFAWSRGNPAFGLPGDQDQLIADIAAVNPNLVVVLNTSQPVALPWLGKARALVQMWWPGDEGGQATARILTGRDSPAGRLPFT